MTTPIILNVVIVTTKSLSAKYFIIFRAQTVQMVQVTVKNMLVLRWSQRAHCFFCGRPKGHVRAPPPKGTVPFGEGLARTLHFTCILLIGTLAIFLSLCTHSCLPQDCAEHIHVHVITCSGKAMISMCEKI